MSVRLGWMALVALLVTALPAAAQQDTSAAGRQGQGVTDQPAGEMQTQTADTAGLTTRQGIEGDVTEPAAAGQEREQMDMEDEGAAMPTTASPLAGLLLSGLALVAIGLALRLAYGRR